MCKNICSACGYVHEGDSAPEKCPVCRVPAEKFNEVKEENRYWATEHVLGVAKGAPEEIIMAPLKPLKVAYRTEMMGLTGAGNIPEA